MVIVAVSPAFKLSSELVKTRKGSVVSTGMDRVVSSALSLPAKSENVAAFTCTIPVVVLLTEGVNVAV